MNTFLNILRSILIFSLIFGSLSFAQEKEIAAGKAAMQSGDLTKAIEMFRKATREDKKNVEAHILLAEALYKADSLDALNIVIVIAKDLDPKNPSIYILQGDAWSKQKLPVPAIAEYTKATELDSNNLDAWVKLAEAQRKARQYNEAAKTYQTVLGLDSMNVVALRALGEMLYRGKQYVRALDYIEKLVRTFPDSVGYQTKYVKCLSAANRYQDLLPIAEPLVEKDPSLTETQEILDDAYVKLRMNRKVIDSYKSRSLESLKAEDLVRYVKALQSEQVYDTAETVYKALFKKDPGRCDMLYYFGTTEMKLKKWAEAVEQFEKKIACDTAAGFQFASHLNAAMSLMQLKKFKEAIDHTKKAIEYRPDNVQAWTVLAQCHGQIDQFADEVAAYRKVIAISAGSGSNGDDRDPKFDPFVEEAYRMIGTRKLFEAVNIPDPEKNRPLYEEAARNIEKALQINPKNCDGLYFAGVAYQNSNNKDKAKRYYNRFLDSCPKDKRREEVEKNLKSLGS